MMFSADQIADIQGINKVHQNLLKQIDDTELSLHKAFENKVYYLVKEEIKCLFNV